MSKYFFGRGFPGTHVLDEEYTERDRVNTAGHEHYSGEYTKWSFSFDVNRYKYGGRSRFLSR